MMSDDFAVVRQLLAAHVDDPLSPGWAEALAALDRIEARLKALEDDLRKIVESKWERHWYGAEYPEALLEARADAERLAAALRKTFARVEGYTGPDMWWAKEARAALAVHEAYATLQEAQQFIRDQGGVPEEKGDGSDQ